MQTRETLYDAVALSGIDDNELSQADLANGSSQELKIKVTPQHRDAGV